MLKSDDQKWNQFPAFRIGEIPRGFLANKFS